MLLLGVVVGVGLTEGLGLALVVPLLGSLGDTGAQGRSGPNMFAWSLASLGLPQTLSGLIAAFVLVAFIRAACVRGRDILVAVLRVEFVGNLRTRLYRAITRAGWPFLASARGSDLSAALSTEIDRIGQGLFFVLQIPARLVVIAVNTAVAFWVAPSLSLLTIAVGTGLALLARRQVARNIAVGRVVTAANRSLYAQIAGLLGALKTAKGHGSEARYSAAFAATIAEVDDKTVRFNRETANVRMMQNGGGAVLLGFFLWIGATYLRLPGTRLVLLFLVFSRLLPAIQELQGAIQQIVGMVPSIDAVRQTLARCEAAAEPVDGSDSPPLRHEIRLHTVGFAYPDGTPVLEGAELTLPAGSLTLLTGPSGIGKTTLLDLLAGLLVPVSGRITIDGETLTPERARGWRGTIAYVTQETALFHDSIRANLIWARPGASDDELREALDRAGAGFVFDLPQGLDTVIGDRGNRLSGGEGQRIALARALLRRPALLILDEATSALDPEIEDAVMQAVAALRSTVTTVVVSHRPPASLGPDQILTLRDGRLTTLESHAV